MEKALKSNIGGYIYGKIIKGDSDALIVIGIGGSYIGARAAIGVEAYKKNMFALLGKTGYEDLKAELEAKL